jgi:hypothetical protein
MATTDELESEQATDLELPLGWSFLLSLACWGAIWAVLWSL